MKKSLIFTLALTTAVLGGCGKAALMARPEVPASQPDRVEATITFDNDGGSIPEKTQLPKKVHIVNAGSRVVINVPSQQDKLEQANDAQQRKSEFETAEFFDQAEQEIEKGLITHGFRVLSRDKFEAKLRKLRDETKKEGNGLSKLKSQVPPEFRHVVDSLERKLESGKLTDLEFAEQVQALREKFKISSAGRSRRGDDHELTDIAEVIRAAQSGTVKADYILQINRFDTDKKETKKADLRKNKDVRAFTRKYPAIRHEMDKEDNYLISCKIYGAELNAKLIHVKTGEIVWIGNYGLDEFSSGLQTLKVEVAKNTYVTNARDVERFVSRQNTDDARKRRKGKEVTIPEWQYQTALIKYTIIDGNCNKIRKKQDPSTISRLSRKVAKDLIKTIRMD